MLSLVFDRMSFMGLCGNRRVVFRVWRSKRIGLGDI